MTLLDRVRALRLDPTPLRTSPDFRLLLAGGVVFYVGAMVSYVAVPFQVYALTRSSWAVGAVGLVELLPVIVFGLYGGALADHADRRTMMVATGLAQVLLTAVLAGNAFLPHPQVWVVYVVAALLAIAQSLQRPSREALLPRTVRHDELPAAVALNSFGVQAAMLAGPALGGVLLQTAGVAWCFVVDVVGIVTATTLLARLRPYPVGEHSTPPSLRGVVEGITYAVSRQDLLGTYVVDLVAMFLAVPTVLYPALTQDVLHRPEVYGVMMSVETAGALLASLTSGWTRRFHHHGRAVVLAAVVWGLAIACVGLTSSVPLLLLSLAVAGAADALSGMFRSIIWHQTIPDHMRGRLAGIELLSYSVGPLGGQARAGLVADRWGVRQAIVSGGVLCAVGVLGAAGWLRGFWAYDARTDEHAVAERRRRAQEGD